MTSMQRRALWGSTIAVGVLLIAAGAYLGLEKTNALSGIISAIAGVLGVAIGIHQILSNPSGTANAAQSQQSGANSVNIQGGRDVTLGDNNQIGK
ncbi:hypothetical protein AB0O67_24095 [Streptomyces sp. NPDC086077]|uniref:hypothetical protein n=1 Tax=Streptomyces sp. NPDC086077 TaxID=3154862 RepID=UPI00343FF301